MELQHHHSCVLPANGSEFDPSSLGTSLDGPSTQHRGVLQERSINWPHEHSTASPVTNTLYTSSRKPSRSQSPAENVYSHQSNPGGTYFTGNVHAHHIGLAGFGVERPAKQIKLELKRLYQMLDRSDKYKKYREKQPVLTPAEFLAREERERRNKVDKDKSPEKSVWPEFLERAFWTALIRWPPMGRKKYMLEGALRGRNELIQDSIYKETGIRRDRKQVSSHLQVLKQHLRDQPSVLVYMATKEDDKKRHRAREASNPYHMSHMTGRHHPQRTAASKYEYGASTPQLWSGFGALQSSLPTGLGLNGFGPSPYAVADFTMVVEDDEQRVHDFTKLFSDGRQGDLNASDATSWHQKYPEFEFLRAQREEWAKKNQRVLVCDASIKVMTETRPNAHLLIAFNLHSQRDLSQFESLECTTRFFDNGSKAPDHQFDGSSAHDLKEHRTSCEYTHDPHGCNSRLRLAFGSKFWVHRMSRYQSLRHKDESLVSRSLLRLTATQDVYGIKRGTGEAECILTILWRFRQTRDSAEVGAMKWRAVSFSDQYPAPKPEWVKQEDHIGSIDDMSSEQVLDCSATAAAETPLYHQTSNLPLEYQHPQIQNPYVVQPILNQPPPQLHIDTLSHMAFSAPDLEQPSASAAPSTATDYSSHHGLNLSHNQDTVAGFGHDTDYDYGNHHIGMPSAFEPAINMSAYESFASQSAGLDGLNALAGLDHDNLLSLGLSSNDMVHVSGGAGIPDADLCYSTKPSWHHGSNLIHTLESAAAADPYHPFVSHNQTSHGHQVYEPNHGEELVSHGLHNGGVNVNVNAGLWNLQSPFHEDTSGGANLLDCRKGHGQGLGLGVLDMIERDQRARGY